MKIPLTLGLHRFMQYKLMKQEKAFATDYVSLYMPYYHGGIYIDTDVGAPKLLIRILKLNEANNAYSQTCLSYTRP